VEIRKKRSIFCLFDVHMRTDGDVAADEGNDFIAVGQPYDNTTFTELIYISWCCVDRLSWQRLRQIRSREVAVYRAGVVSDGEERVEANCFRARNNLERIAPGGTCSISPASSVEYS
jgi:hypothetical protein